MSHRSSPAALILFALLSAELPAQEFPLLDARTVQVISQEISGDASYAHVRDMTRFHRPRAGSDNLMLVARYFEQKAREYGLEDVRLLRQRSTTVPWNPGFADLWILEPEPQRIASTLQSPLHLADYSRSADVVADLVDVGRGRPEDFEGKEVQGRIVLTHGPMAAVMREAVILRGAAGLIWYPDPYAPVSGTDGTGNLGRPDQIRWVSVPSGQVDGRDPTFAFVLSLREGTALSRRIAVAPSPIRVRARVESSFGSREGDQPWQVMVEGFLRGTEPGLGQDIVLTAHLQEEAHSANDDASGCANVLEIARALTRLIADGVLPRPRRNIRFWWLTEISSQRQYFADHPEAHRAMWVNVNQDMVGADQSLDVMRKQNVTRLPATRFHFFNDVMEAVVQYLVATNTAELAQQQAGIPLYPRPILAKQGSMHRYNAEAIWFHYNTDHMPFNEAPIGVPGITFTNMPDRFIHSNEDDLWNLDATQLGRNAVAAALIAWTMAMADGQAWPALAAETVGRGQERLARNLRLGLTWLATSPDRAGAYWTAMDQVAYAAGRERLALRSLAQVAPDLGGRVEPLLAELARREAQAVRELQASYRELTGSRALPTRPAVAAEADLARLRPVLTGGPVEFLARRGRIGGTPGLHSLMAAEVLNAIDGRRTGLDIYRYVAAEAREAGPHYYGTVTAEAVLTQLRNIERAEVARLDGR
jgi:hypothetical protein